MRRVEAGQCNRSPAASARAIGGQSQIVRAQVNTRQCRQKIPVTMAPNASHTSKEPPCSRADGKVRPQATGNDATKGSQPGNLRWRSASKKYLGLLVARQAAIAQNQSPPGNQHARC